MEKNQTLDPETWVDQHGDSLYRYALFRVREVQVAEDLVQETFLAALGAKDSFAGHSAIRAWLFGILKHKIIDHIGKISRERPQEDIESATNLSADLFDQHGGWKIESQPRASEGYSQKPSEITGGC